MTTADGQRGVLAEDAPVAAFDSAVAGPSTWSLDAAHSSVALRHKTMWGLVTVRGTFSDLSGTGELYPETQLGIGPAIDNGFYYDFDRPTPFTPDDLEKIEKKMWEIQARALPYERVLTPKEEGLKKYSEAWMKCQLIEEKAGDIFTEYTLGPRFIDFCRGPHVPDTSKIKAFKLLSIAGAYWKGDEHNKQLQRIYGTAFFSAKDLDAYLKQVEEAKKRDHRKLGKELDLFSIQELAGPGLIFFHPKGGIIRKQLEDWMRDQYLKRGYSLVYTPHVARIDLWKTSGHANFYAANMFTPIKL